jgi:uncharacterized OsmC-like protein
MPASLVPSRSFAKVALSASSLGAWGISGVAEGHTIIVDQGKPVGLDAGPNPLHSVLGALLGCTQFVTQYVAQERDISIGAVKWHAEADFDGRGVRGDPTVFPGFTAVKVTGEIADTSATPAQLAELAHAVDSRCPVAAMLAAVPQLDFSLTLSAAHAPGHGHKAQKVLGPADELNVM